MVSIPTTPPCMQIPCIICSLHKGNQGCCALCMITSRLLQPLPAPASPTSAPTMRILLSPTSLHRQLQHPCCHNAMTLHYIAMLMLVPYSWLVSTSAIKAMRKGARGLDVLGRGKKEKKGSSFWLRKKRKEEREQ